MNTPTDNRDAHHLFTDLDPSDISFSQVTISNSFEWNPERYQTRIIVARYEDGHYCSYDNRRLCAAQMHQTHQPTFRLSCDALPWNQTMNLQREERQNGVFDYVFFVTSTPRGVYKLLVVPKTHGALIALRCALQASDMPLTGTTVTPEIKQRYRQSDVALKGPRSHEYTLGPSESATLLQAAMDSDDDDSYTVALSYSPAGQKFCHPDLRTFFRGHVEDYLEFVAGSVCYPNMWLKAAAAFDADDEYHDQQAAEMDRLDALQRSALLCE